jgi:hypothetical protein
MRPGGTRSDNIVKEQVAFVEPIIGARKPNRPAAILLEETRLGF